MTRSHQPPQLLFQVPIKDDLDAKLFMAEMQRRLFNALAGLRAVR